MGEVGSGKTLLTTRLLLDALNEGFKAQVTVIDLAPKALTIEGKVIGGKIKELFQIPKDLRYIASDKIRAPRLEGKSKKDVIRYAYENLKVIEPMFEDFEKSPTDVLFVNDLSIYLHMGDVLRLRSVLSKARTVIANAYEGKRLQADKGTGISQREAKGLNDVKGWMDIIIRLDRSSL